MTTCELGRTVTPWAPVLAMIALSAALAALARADGEPPPGAGPLLTAERLGPGVAIATTEPVTVQAHRGFGKGYPENTLEAFRKAWELGVAPEGDIRITKDGVNCFFHDSTIGKKSDAPPDWAALGIADLAWEQVATLDVGSWVGDEYAGQRIPTMDEVFAELASDPDRLMYLDIKYADAQALADALHEHDVAGQVRVCSPRPAEMLEYHELVPEAECMVWVPDDPAEMERVYAEMRQSGFEGIGRVQQHTHATEAEAGLRLSPSPETLGAIRAETAAAGVRMDVFLYTERDEVMGYALSIGVDSFATDNVEWCADRLRAFAAPGWAE